MSTFNFMYWKWGIGFGSAHKDSITGQIIIDKWSLPQPEPTEAEIQTAINEYSVYLTEQDAKYIQYKAKMAALDYDDINNIVNGITSLTSAKTVIKKMLFYMISLGNIIREDRKVK